MNIYKSDNGGFAVKCDDVKLFIEGSTWNTKLSQLGKIQSHLYIMTNDLNKLDYIDQIFSKRPYNISLLVNATHKDKAKEVKDKYPKIEVRHIKNLNAKVVLLAPRTTMYSSSDFGSPYYINPQTGWNELTMNFGVGFHSEEIFEIMLNRFNLIWDRAEEIY